MGASPPASCCNNPLSSALSSLPFPDLSYLAMAFATIFSFSTFRQCISCSLAAWARFLAAFLLGPALFCLSLARRIAMIAAALPTGMARHNYARCVCARAEPSPPFKLPLARKPQTLQRPVPIPPYPRELAEQGLQGWQVTEGGAGSRRGGNRSEWRPKRRCPQPTRWSSREYQRTEWT